MRLFSIVLAGFHNFSKNISFVHQENCTADEADHRRSVCKKGFRRLFYNTEKIKI